MNLSRGNCETIKKYHKKVVAVVDMPHPCKIFFFLLFVDFVLS